MHGDPQAVLQGFFAATTTARLRRRLVRETQRVDLGSLRRTEPVSRHWGYERGTPVDRYYIESFLAHNRGSIAGRVLEVKNSAYTDRFGHGVVRSDILDVDPGNPHATIVADLRDAAEVADDSFDCFVLTQTLQLIYEVQLAVAEAHRILAPGGVLLVSVPTMSRIVREPGVADYWRFTEDSCARLLADAFGAEQVVVRAYGNVLACVAFIEGLAAEELKPAELDEHDPDYPLVILARAVKAERR
jgi:SAM-dependent methyltransferase